MGRIAEIVHIRRQDGAISGSRSTFLRAQVEVPKGVILGPYKIDVGELKRRLRGPFWMLVLEVQNGVVLVVFFRSQFKLTFEANLYGIVWHSLV